MSVFRQSLLTLDLPYLHARLAPAARDTLMRRLTRPELLDAFAIRGADRIRVGAKIWWTEDDYLPYHSRDNGIPRGLSVGSDALRDGRRPRISPKALH